MIRIAQTLSRPVALIHILPSTITNLGTVPMAGSAAQADADARAAADDAAMDQMIDDYGLAGANGGPLVPVGGEPEDPQWYGKGKGKGKGNPEAWWQDWLSVETADRLRAFAVRVGCLDVYDEYMARAVADRDRRSAASCAALGARPN